MGKDTRRSLQIIAEITGKRFEDVQNVWRDSEDGADPMILRVVFKDGTEQTIVIRAKEELH